MLGDPRSRQFCTNFSDQWLSLDKLGSMPPDTKGEYKDYYKLNLEAAMLEETHMYFRNLLDENRSIGEFIKSDYTFVNNALAVHYGLTIEELGANPSKGRKKVREDARIDPNKFLRVTLPPDSKRGGLLGHGSILTLSANGVETSPVERGVWVLADLLGTPPPPPPKAVPALTPDLNGAVTIREMLEKHRSDQACMQCHRRIDPLGFALESFDPIGHFRTTYSPKQPVSTKGNYLSKNFNDVSELKQILSSDIRPFARNLIIRISEYAKGRKLEPRDFKTVEAIVDQSAASNYRFRDLIILIATSELMTNR
jgi:hypothetical protein